MPINSTSPDVTCPFLTRKKKTSLFISLCTLRDLSQQKIPRELCGGEDPPYVSMFQWKGFFDGTNQENSKTRGGKGQRRKGTD